MSWLLCHGEFWCSVCIESVVQQVFPGVTVPVGTIVDGSAAVVGPYRYSSAGRSLLEPLMQRYWEWLVGQVPSWIAPNLITIIGLATNVFTTLVLVYYCPTATEQVSY